MKKITLIALMLFTALGYAQVGINTNNPDVSSALEIESTTGGILIPRMTELQRDAISSPATGLMVYQSDNNFGFYFYNGAQWTNVAMSGPAGPQGEVGPQGQQGEQGPAGNDGQDGVDGAVGPLGPAGADGQDGAVGPVGPQGPYGADGQDGAVGPQGQQGEQGPAGADGQDGAVGTLGPQGPAGAIGPAGPTGPAGAEGQDGAVGPQGPAGADGQDGAVGPQGPAGADGQDGAVGPVGPQGPYGADGQDGAVGPQGQQGEQGPAGADGQDGAVGPVGPAGNDGQYGVDGAVGPQGIQGETGATGPTGPVGAQGIPGSNGIDGVNGSSAYEIWLNLGNTGSEQDFIDSLTGPQGEQGSTGQSGASSILIGAETTCQSAQQLDVGTMVYSYDNSNVGSLNVVAQGPDCSQTPIKLFSTPQTVNGETNNSIHWIFNVSEPIYVYDLPYITTNQFGNGYFRILKLQNYYDSVLDSASVDDALISSQAVISSSDSSDNYYLLEPGVTYSYSSAGNNWNTRVSYSSNVPPYDVSLFISLGQFQKLYGGGEYESTTRMATGIDGSKLGFSYSSPGKVFQTIVDW